MLWEGRFQLLKEIEKGKNGAIQRYLNRYTKPNYPPSWVVIETLSFGICSTLFAHLRKRQIRLVSQKFDLEPKLLISWMQGLTRLRNICAHHIRTWNRTFAHQLSKYGKVSKKVFKNLEPNNSLYAYLSVIKILLDKVSPNCEWPKRLVALLEKHPKVPQLAMGFPQNWQQRELWKETA